MSSIKSYIHHTKKGGAKRSRKDTTLADFRKAVSICKKFSKCTCPIYVRRSKISDNLDGYCTKLTNRFEIRINRQLPLYVSVDVLLHEVAHAMAWDKDIDDHGDNWGKAYSKIYRIFLREYFGEGI
jgi:hypothetical protein